MSHYYKKFIIFYMMTAALLSSVILYSNASYAITSQDSTITYNENYKQKNDDDDVSTRYLMNSLPNVDYVKSPFKDYEMTTTTYEKDQINYDDDYHNYKNNKYYHSDDYYQVQDKTVDAITTGSIGSSSGSKTFDSNEFLPYYYKDKDEGYYYKYPSSQGDEKYVILMFDRGYESIFSMAKPIMDQYGFKASIFIACDYIDSQDGMSWNQVRQLYDDGYDIQAHGLEHQKLKELDSDYEIESIVGGGKYCLQDKGFNPTVFQAPYNKGGDDPKIVDIISKYFDSGFTGHSELMFLNCDGWENFGYDKKSYEGITDCRPYFSDGTPTPTNKYGMKEWSHDREHDSINDEYDDDKDPHGEFISYKLFEKFVEIVESQREFNRYGEINAIPIIGYHEISKEKSSVSTSPELFEEEMKYFYENGFNVITLADLGYDDYQERFYVNDASNSNNNKFRS